MNNLDIGFAVWLTLLTAANILIFVSFRKMTKFSERANIKRLIDKIRNKQGENTKDIKTLGKELEEIIDDARSHIQKVGLVRFNPFDELGGDHSFSLALISGKDDGFIITGLHARERTRVYLKKIIKGKSKVALSNEEEKALKAAIRGTS